MIGDIRQIDIDQLRLLLLRGWARRISEIHVHHTWKPNHADWRGQSTVEAIRRYHMEECGWSDIAEHLTTGPDGSLWTGRNLDRPPASAKGHNGNAVEGPLMIEMVGNFDLGHDTFGGAQATIIYDAAAAICEAFSLNVEAIRFHNEFNPAKTCPGTSLRLAAFRQSVAGAMAHALGAPAPVNRAGRAYVAQFGRRGVATRGEEHSDAEPRYDARQAAYDWAGDDSGRSFGRRFSEAEIDVFRGHVVNLSGGQLSQGGVYSNTESDLDGLISRLDQWAKTHAGNAARIVLFAHGGLVDETAGLSICLRDHNWWLGNGVYPLFFVWETGFFEALEQEWRRQKDEQRAFITDPIFEALLGPTIGNPTWDRIKTSALLSSSVMTGTGKPGGAALFARKLAEWNAAFNQQMPVPRPVEWHAVGHSAGAIFHCHFLPALEAAFSNANGGANAPPALTKTLHLLAPAVRVDLFRRQLMARVGATIGEMSLFTMKRNAERRDHVIHLYRKSLLYFVKNACEDPTHSTPILGLEESIRTDADLSIFLGLGNAVGTAQTIWSPTTAGPGRSASQSTSHGGFDEDSPTMNSVLRRILALGDADPVPVPHLGKSDVKVRDASSENSDRVPVARKKEHNVETNAKASGSGARRALCVGIDLYGPQSLTGCVADAQSFADTLGQWGFDVRLLTNERATREAIASGIDRVLAESQAGDTAVIQFAGHGTQLQDASGDESDGYDEAWVPFDYDSGEFVIDDDVGALLDRYRDRGIELVMFTDCCHSGTSTRVLFTSGSPQVKPNSRYLRVPKGIEQKFLRKRGGGQAASRFGRGGDGLGWEIHFAACQDKQSAYEHDGHGDFTVATTKALASALQSAVSYASLESTIAAAFSGNPVQTPKLRAPSGDKSSHLFGHGRMTAPPTMGTDLVPDSDRGAGQRIGELTVAINALIKKLDTL